MYPNKSPLNPTPEAPSPAVPTAAGQTGPRKRSRRGREKWPTYSSGDQVSVLGRRGKLQALLASVPQSSTRRRRMPRKVESGSGEGAAEREAARCWNQNPSSLSLSLSPLPLWPLESESEAVLRRSGLIRGRDTAELIVASGLKLLQPSRIGLTSLEAHRLTFDFVILTKSIYLLRNK
jgi:hypothetical protein